MVDFSMKNHFQTQGGGSENASLVDSSSSSPYPVLSNNHWKGRSSQQINCDWMLNYVNGSSVSDDVGGISNIQSYSFIEGIMPATTTVKEVDFSASSMNNLKPSSSSCTAAYQHVVHASVTNSSTSQPSAHGCLEQQQQFREEMPFSTTTYYHPTALEEVVNPSTMEQGQGCCEMTSSSLLHHQNNREAGCDSWMKNTNEMLISLGSSSGFKDEWRIDRPDVGGSNQHGGDLRFAVERNISAGDLGTVVGDSAVQGLSLTLSTHPASELPSPQTVALLSSRNLQLKTATSTGVHQASKTGNSSYLCTSNPKSSICSRGYRIPAQAAVVGSMRSAGPLGPFTGYATILQSSKFLKPAQQLLDEFSGTDCQMLILAGGETSDLGPEDVTNIRLLSNPMNAENRFHVRGGISGDSSSVSIANETAGDGDVGSGFHQFYNPEFQLLKEKLLHMQEEVCRRYKLFDQQLQLVVSSFESVAGLSAAAPYTSSALKSILKHFHYLKNAISNQLQYIVKALKKEISPTAVSTSGYSPGFLRTRDVWRSQRGLPERSVTVLRAWLFNHFLHPYPSETDKHMLATQTGLGINQVSNWFINARVRLWKPMVEEIHMLDTKGSGDINFNPSKNETTFTAGSNIQTIHQGYKKLKVDTLSDQQPGYSTTFPAQNPEVVQNSGQWHQNERTRVECQIHPDTEGLLMGIAPYYRTGLEIGELEALSLTLGLRQNMENSQQQQQQQQQKLEHTQTWRQHFGGQILHDFVG